MRCQVACPVREAARRNGLAQGQNRAPSRPHQVERSFRMAKTDLRARPIFHHQRDSIEAHLTIVFAALAISRHLQHRSGVSIKKLGNTLRTVRSATIQVIGQRLTLHPELPPTARELLTALGHEGH